VHVVEYDARAAEVADHVVTLAEAEDLPGHGAAVRVRFEGSADRTRHELSPDAARAAGIEPYGAPQLDVPVQLNVNENPYGPSPTPASPTSRRPSRGARDLNRYPDREFTALREALAAYLDTDGARG
jgi:hypothetical protein